MPLLSEFTYPLPDERIAKYPLADRSASKLLHYNNGSIEDKVFKNISDILKTNSSLFFNNTKVIPARLFFQKETGAKIEIFLLHPISPTNIVQLAMEVKGEAVWECMIGNSKKWKHQDILKQIIQIEGKDLLIQAQRIEGENKQVRLIWDESIQFSEIVEALGNIPLPPYLNRDTEENDLLTYQTVYSKEKGAVAAPTAGLHFTDDILEDIENKNIDCNYLTLHVGAGTFMPVKHDNVLEHPMHNEQIVISKSCIEAIINSKNDIIPVGTTSMRSLESLYWYGVKLSRGDEKFFIPKMYAYEQPSDLSRKESFQLILDYMNKNSTNIIIGETEIFIFPSYKFKTCDGLITNFHQPASTLIMLVAALIGDDWKKVYNHALDNDYRFLSYGDSSLLMP